MRAITQLVIHHSASPTGSVETITRDHVARGFETIGYHNVIGNGRPLPDGHISAGRPHEKIGAGVFGANSGKLQVCLIGNFARTDEGYAGPPTEKQLDSLGHWILTNLKRYGIRSSEIYGHREVAIAGHGTLCPGFGDKTLREIRRWALEMQRDGTQCTLSAWLYEKIGRDLL